ncbi:pilus assembly protein PilM [Candidatus Saccharibacteria bacterium]|nr:MAG: pilus assembly protein PilM [Candidatus Saccharibacteria bacterium]PID98898.1 MAG: pilus assembly protein PilM [Candidatus Saccharibacteria bacterium]
MSVLSGVSSFFGLDIGTTGVRIVELRGSGSTRSLVKYAYVPLDVKIAQSDSKADQQKLAQVLSNLISQARMSTRNVAVGLPSSRVFTTVIDFDRIPQNEMGQAIQYQAESLIPTPPAESKIDWGIIGDSPKDQTKVEVLLSSVSNGYVEQRLDMIESIGLNVIAFEPDSLALTRSLVPAGTTAPQLIVDIGQLSTDLVITMADAPRLTRSIPTGVDAIVRTATQNLNIDEKQAQQFVYKFGVSKDKLEGQVYQAIIGTIDLLVSEIDKSVKFFQTRYPETPIERMIVTGGASSIPDFPLYLANKFGVNVEIGNAWRNVSFASDRQNELLAVSNQFSVAVGLAERNE